MAAWIHNTQVLCGKYARFLFDSGKVVESESMGKIGIRSDVRRQWGEEIRRNHGETLIALDNFAQAAELLGKHHSYLVAERGPDHSATRSTIELLISCYEQWDALEPDAGHD